MAEEARKSEFQEALDRGIPAGVARAKAGDLAGAIEDLLALEKKCRIGGDAFATSKVAVAIVNLCWEMQDLKQLNTQIMVLCKRRGQLKQAISDLVQAAMALIDNVANKDDRVELITTLKTVTDGKIYVEVERARITKKLAHEREGEGRINEASETLQEVQIETYGSMEKDEKAEFITEQVRLAVRQKDFVRAGILANKMNKKVLDEAGFEGVRVRYYRLLDAIARHKHDALAIVKHAQAVLATRGYAEDEAKWKPVLASAMVHLALCPWSNEVSDLMHKTLADRRTEELPAYRALLKMLTTQELIAWPLPAPHGQVIMADPAFHKDLLEVGADALPPVVRTGAGAGAGSGSGMEVDQGAGSNAAAGASGHAGAPSEALGGEGASAASKVGSVLVLAEDEARCRSWWPILRKRCVQHNLRVIAKAYTRLTLPRLAQLLGVDAPTTEAMIAELVSAKAVYAKMDRPAGRVVFTPPKPAASVLSGWGEDLEQLLGLVEKAHHLIEKEAQVHGVVVPGTRV